jgi:hypothetical protein
MKKIAFAGILISFLAVLGISVSMAKSALRGERMDVSDAERAWGVQPFSAEKFKNGGVGVRAAMAAKIVQKKEFVGSSVEEVERSLGRHDAYFKNDFIPAYALNEGWKTGEDTWQLVFLPDRDLKIVDVFIHKNCCKR